MSYDPSRDYVQIKDRTVLHSTARRNWVCGTCGGKLTTRFCKAAPHWQTVCIADPDHDPDAFIHGSTWEYLEAKRQAESIEASEVFAYLPKELQEAIARKEG